MKRIMIVILVLLLCLTAVSCIEIHLPEPAVTVLPQTPTPEISLSPSPAPMTPEPQPTVTLSPIPEPTSTPAVPFIPIPYTELFPTVSDPFVARDWRINRFHYGDDMAEVLAHFGAANSMREEVWGATGETHAYYEYAFGEIEFVDGQLAGAKIYTDAVAGPRGITVGMTAEEVIRMFHTGFEKQNGDMVIFYRENPGRNNWELLPPYGIVTNYTKIMLTYTWYDRTLYDLHETLDTLESNAIYLNKLSFSMYINGQGIVKEIYLRSGAEAE